MFSSTGGIGAACLRRWQRQFTTMVILFNNIRFQNLLNWMFILYVAPLPAAVLSAADLASKWENLSAITPWIVPIAEGAGPCSDPHNFKIE